MRRPDDFRAEQPAQRSVFESFLPDRTAELDSRRTTSGLARLRTPIS